MEIIYSSLLKEETLHVFHRRICHCFNQ